MITCLVFKSLGTAFLQDRLEEALAKFCCSGDVGETGGDVVVGEE